MDASLEVSQHSLSRLPMSLVMASIKLAQTTDDMRDIRSCRDSEIIQGSDEFLVWPRTVDRTVVINGLVELCTYINRSVDDVAIVHPKS